MILNLRGTGGSGKSYVGWKLIETYGVVNRIIEPPNSKYNERKKEILRGVELPGNLALLGRWEMKRNGSYSGGLEGWGGKGSAAQIRDYIFEKAQVYDHLYVEGLFLSLNYGPWFELAERLYDANVHALPLVFGFLNTPKEVCLERIYSRNGGKEIDMHATVDYPYSRHVGSLWDRFDESPYDNRWVPWQQSYDWVEQAFRSDGWRP